MLQQLDTQNIILMQNQEKYAGEKMYNYGN